jgi:NADH-quinone oxidoreductase subunit L
MSVLLLIPLLPALGALINGAVGIRCFGKRVSALVACGTMAASLALSLWVFAALLAEPPASREHFLKVASWITPIPLEMPHGVGSFAADWAFRLDPLSGMMILVVTGVGFLIHVYSTAYMAAESDGAYARYFSYLNLFCFFMLTLVLASNFLVLFVGWEGVGLCSYLLIGYWYEKKKAADAGMKAFLVNRIGDFGFLLGMLLVFTTFGTLDFRAVAEAAAAMPIEAAGFGTISLASALLFVGATGKSAQVPLHVWLPDAMEGPTPVSALIHAATMVTAGVYMVCRNAILFTHAPLVMEAVAIIGLLTALLAASIGLVQTDIKRVLAYSTVSQLGLMFLATGVGAFAAGAFHLMTHAFFKALLFLGAGSVIHALAGEQDLRRMGGLKRYLPLTFATMMIGTLAIAGVPPLSGFFSKDEILYRTFHTHRLIGALAFLTAAMTAFYMMRLMVLTYYGTYRGPSGRHAWHGPHESPRLMTIPLILLAAGAAVAGFVGVPRALGGSNEIERFLEPSFTVQMPRQASQPVESGLSAPEAAHRGATEGPEASVAPERATARGAVPEYGRLDELTAMIVSFVLAVAALAFAWRIYQQRPELADRLATRFAATHRVLENKYYVDELFDATIVRGTLLLSRACAQFDTHVVDGVVNGSAWATRFSAWLSGLVDRAVVDGAVNATGSGFREASHGFRRMQTGLIQNYALLMMIGVFAFVSVYLLAR